jgi:hypothetical protein
MIKMYSYISSTKLGHRTNDIDSIALKNSFALSNLNHYHNISWKQPLANKWRLQAGISYSNNKDELTNELQDAAQQRQITTNPIYFAFKNYQLVTNGRYFQNRIILEKNGGP